MPDLAHWSVFLAATIVLLMIPGPSVMYVVARGIDQGFRAALFSSLGLVLGDLVQVLGAALGLSALLASSAVLFTIVKYAGAAYLVYLGLRRIFEKGASVSDSLAGAARQRSSRSLVMQGFLAFNPKTTLFFIAFLPQFVAPNAGPAWLQILLFGCVFVLLGFITLCFYGSIGGQLGSFARRNPRFQSVTRLLNGATLIALGVSAALTPTPRRATQ